MRQSVKGIRQSSRKFAKRPEVKIGERDGPGK